MGQRINSINKNHLTEMTLAMLFCTGYIVLPEPTSLSDYPYNLSGFTDHTIFEHLIVVINLYYTILKLLFCVHNYQIYYS